MKSTYEPTDAVWEPNGSTPLDEQVIRHLGPADGWQPGEAPTALVRGVGHPSHVRINGWPYAYVGTTQDGDALYQTY